MAKDSKNQPKKSGETEFKESHSNEHYGPRFSIGREAPLDIQAQGQRPEALPRVPKGEKDTSD